MTYAIITNETLEDMGDALREATGGEDTYLPSEMPDAIRGLSAGGAAFEPQPVTGISAKVGHEKVGLLFDDPEDLSYLGYDIYEWAGTKVVRKAGMAPSSQSDGALVANSTTHDGHVSSYLEDTGLTDGTTYYYGLFPYTTAGVYNTDPSQIIAATPSALTVGTASALAAKIGNNKATITWSDPADIADTAARYGTAWAKTELVRKEGSVPSDPSDGTLVATSTTRNQYSSTGYTDTGLTNGTTYYYGAFAYSADGAVSEVVAVAATPSALGIGSCTNLAVTAGNATAAVTWSDPSNVADTSARYGANWARTVLVRKAGSAPTSPTDGTVVVTETTRNQYSSTAFNDTGLANGTTYYYAAFAISSDGVASTAATASATPTAFDPSKIAFATATDAEIGLMISKANAGDITLSDYWSVGDTRVGSFAAMAATGVGESHVAQDVVMVIEDFNHYDKSDGSGKAVVTIGMRDMMANGTSREGGYMNSSNDNTGGWRDCARRTWANNVLKAAAPAWIADNIKQVKIRTADGSGDTYAVTDDYWFMKSEKEVFGTIARASSTAESTLTQLAYYATAANRIKNAGASGSAGYWWLRSPRSGGATSFVIVSSSGAVNGVSASNGYGLALSCCL